MTIRQATVPFQERYNYGVGADLVSGSPMGMVVDGRSPDVVTGVTGAHGGATEFTVQRILTTEDLPHPSGEAAPKRRSCTQAEKLVS